MFKSKIKIPMNEKEMLEASLQNKSSKIFAAKKLAKWFQVDVVIKIFGVVVFEYHFPPSETETPTEGN